MKKTLALLLAGLMTLGMFAGCGSKEKEYANQLEKVLDQGYITMATSPDWAPYEFQDLNKTGQDAIVGCDIELAKYIADYIGVELKIEAMDFDSAQAAVGLGTAEFSIAGYGYTDERAQLYLLSDYYNFNTTDDAQCIIVKGGTGAGLKTADDFKGMTIATQVGSLQMGLVTNQLPGATIEPITSLPTAILMLMNDKVDGVACAGDTANQFIDSYKGQIEKADFKLEYFSEGSVILGKKGDTELMAKINEALKKAADEGKYQVWMDDAVKLADSLGVETN